MTRNCIRIKSKGNYLHAKQKTVSWDTGTLQTFFFFFTWLSIAKPRELGYKVFCWVAVLFMQGRAWKKAALSFSALCAPAAVRKQMFTPVINAFRSCILSGSEICCDTGSAWTCCGFSDAILISISSTGLITENMDGQGLVPATATL